MAKLTLSADPEVIAQAKQLAQRRGISVSTMFSQFVRSFAQARQDEPPRLAPLTKQAIGLVTLPADKTDRELIEEALSERYG